MKRPTLLIATTLLFAGVTLGEPKPSDSPAVAKLKGDYASARVAAVKSLNTVYAGQVELLEKSFMAASDLPNANRAANFVKQLADTDESNDTQGITNPPAGGDRLGNLQARYVKEREDALRKVNGVFANQGRSLQQQCMRNNDLNGANEASKFVAEVTPAPLVAAVAGSPGGAGRGNPLLSPANAKKWKIGGGEVEVRRGKADRIGRQQHYLSGQCKCSIYAPI